MSLLTNLSSYWSCDETTGTTIYDSYGSVDSTSIDAGIEIGEEGIINQGVSGATIGKVTFPNNFTFSGTSSFSISLWWKAAAANTSRAVFLSNKISSKKGWWFGIGIGYPIGGSPTPPYPTYPYNCLKFQILGNNDQQVGQYVVSVWEQCQDTEWHNCVVTKLSGDTPSSYKMYVDGQELWIFGENYPHSDVGYNNFMFGDWGLYSLKGTIDEIGIWENRVLTQSDITSLYNNGLGLPLNDFQKPIVSTSAVTGVSFNEIICGGNVTSSGDSAITGRGICWSTGSTPTTGDTMVAVTGTTGIFTTNVTGLTVNTLYYIRAYAINSYGISYGNEVIYNTFTVTTTPLSATSFTTATGGGSISVGGGADIINRGVCYNTTGTPTTGDTVINCGSGVGSFTANFTGLTTGETYYVRAYAFDTIVGLLYGDEVEFDITIVAPTLTGNGINLFITDNNDLKEHYEIYATECLATYVPLNETSGIYAQDYGYNDLTGITNGSFVNSGRTGGYYCLKLPSEGTRISFGNNFRYNLDSVPFTMTLWVNNFGYPNSDILGTGGGGYHGYNFGFGGVGSINNKMFIYKTATSGLGKLAYANQTLGSGWHFLAVTYDGSNTASGITFYYDNNKLTTIVYADNPTNTLHERSFFIGNRTVFTNSFYGLVEDFRVYDCCLTDSEISNIYSGSVYQLLDTIDYPTLTYPISGDCVTKSYRVRDKIDSISPTVYSDYSNIYSVYLITPPSGLSASNISITDLTLSWINSDCNFDGNYVYIYGNGTWIQIADLASSATTFTVTGLTRGTTYSFRVGAYDDDNIFYSEALEVTTLDYLPSFCTQAAYVVSASTCGTSGGSITITNSDYFIFYDFILIDIDGNSYTFNTTTGEATGLTSGYYFLTATPKYEWWHHYGKDSCTFEWIKIEDSDSDIEFVSLKLKHAVCGGFGNGDGRILIQISGVTGVTFTLWNQRLELIDQQIVTGVTSAITNVYIEVSSDIYYVQLETSGGCKYLSDLIKINKTDLYTVTGIQRLFITPWSATTSYNYYSSSDEDWYVSGIDTLQYTSTKIKEYVDLSDFWYEIKLDTATMSYQETFQKDQNGLTYAETVTISIPKAENAKWKQLVNILTGRYIVVFQDNHDQWWTCFYRYGAEVKAYSLNENQYVITFRHPSVNKMLTSIDYSYIKNSIL